MKKVQFVNRLHCVFVFVSTQFLFLSSVQFGIIVFARHCCQPAPFHLHLFPHFFPDSLLK